MNLKRAKRDTWEGLEERKGRGKLFNYIVIYKIKEFSKGKVLKHGF